VLARRGALEYFFDSEVTVATLRSCFAGLWSLDAADAEPGAVSGSRCSRPPALLCFPSTLLARSTAAAAGFSQAEAIADAKARPHGFVIKPQREGGGNNIYGDAVATALDGGMEAEALAGYILMERVNPQVAPAIFVKGGAVSLQPAVCELGVFSVFVGGGPVDRTAPGAPPMPAPLLSAQAGHLLRTKAVGVDEGGVASGFAVIDSPMLV